jgi:hypothetical protein
MNTFTGLFIIMVICFAVQPTEALSCQFGRSACVASCMGQNCATGYCPNGEKGVCVCSRCGTGAYKPM